MQPPPVTSPVPRPAAEETARNALLMDKARALEASFLAEMLAQAGLDSAEGEFSGGIGEEQYASFLREAQAKAIVGKGGIGLAEQLFKSMLRADDAKG